MHPTVRHHHADLPRADRPDRWLTEHFEPISLDALNAKAAMLERLDHKYVVRASVLARAAPRLETRFDVLEIDGRRSFTYETCYFDDPQRRSYFDHHQGRRRRMKVRVRRYVEAGLYFLEVKLKDKRGVTVKRRLPVDASQSVALDARSRAFVAAAWREQYGDDYHDEHHDACGRASRRPMEPVLQMSYRRITLVAREGGERMTIDTGILFLGGRDAHQTHRTDDATFVVETKSARGRGIADAVLRAQHQHPVDSCSKYCVGMSLTGAVPRFNRFRPALRMLGVWPNPRAEVPHGA